MEARQRHSATTRQQARTDDAPWKRASVEKLRQAFASFDADGNGTLDADELKRILCSPVSGGNTQMTPEEVDQLFRKFDANGDGVLSVEEFAVAWGSRRSKHV